MTVRLALALILAGVLAALAGAYYFQHVAGILPCHLCLLQRWPHVALAGLALLGLVWPSRVVLVAGVLTALGSTGLALYHSGVERKLWAGPSDCTGGQDLTGMTGTDLLSTDAAVAVVQCDEISYSILGLSFANYNAVLSLGLIALWLFALRQPRGGQFR